MPAATVVSIIVAGLAVVVLAIYLIRVALVLRDIDTHLGSVNERLFTVVDKTQPIRSILGEINQDLAEADNSLQRVLNRTGGPSPIAMPRDEGRHAYGESDQARPTSRSDSGTTRHYLR